jgi:hypothetical protein
MAGFVHGVHAVRCRKQLANPLRSKLIAQPFLHQLG